MILEKKIEGLTEADLNRFVLRAKRVAGLRGDITVLLTSNAAMRSLNSRFRRLNKPTDVLSFPSGDKTNGTGANPAGEIAISADIALRNALELGHAPAVEVKILALHGILHLAGYDHERDNGTMARKEAKLRRALNLPVSLIERGQVRSARSKSTRLTSRKRKARTA
ncbi:MAG TPA: rRNA maturation RNase YbeY [Candidatus Sulfotelmatobacter sp.]|nr:rRNA maturation RNase YbeY [Candidatus Sulfotelmatobacter sp.]